MYKMNETTICDAVLCGTRHAQTDERAFFYSDTPEMMKAILMWFFVLWS